MREREMIKVTKCVGVNSFVEALIIMVCELKLLQGLKKSVNSAVIRHCVKELLAKTVLRGHEIHSSVILL